MKSLNKLRVLYFAIKGHCYKWMVDLGVLRVPNLNNSSCDIVVSLTSYGRRVTDGVVYYTLVSVLRQTLQPSKILLWLSEDEWSDDTLPSKLKYLRKKGVEIRYCKDTRSYKKLTPTLKLYPNCNIMTIDDDVIYTKDSINLIWNQHLQNMKSIICLKASMPKLENGVPSNYAIWKELQTSINSLMVFPIGCGGILYPQGSLHEDVLREELFLRLCPLADDIWFWFCGLLNGTEKLYIKKRNTDLSFDALYQYFHKGSALTHTNRFEHANDNQFKDLFDFYNIKLMDSGRLVQMKD